MEDQSDDVRRRGRRRRAGPGARARRRSTARSSSSPACRTSSSPWRCRSCGRASRCSSCSSPGGGVGAAGSQDLADRARSATSGSRGPPSSCSSSSAVIWIPLRRSRLGLSMYAIGSNRLAAFRSGVPVGRTKVLAYALTGLFAALGGLALTASTGIGTPGPGPVHAAERRGGRPRRRQPGRRPGRRVRPDRRASSILQLIQTDMTFLSVNSNLATVAQGVDPHRRGHGRQRHRRCGGARAMSAGRRRSGRAGAALATPGAACSATARSSR